MVQEPLLTTLLDLDAMIHFPEKLIVGGGYGLYLKQIFLSESGHTQTLFPLAELPLARTTEDIDLILRAEIVTDSRSMKLIRDALDQLGFVPVETAKYTQFARPMSPGVVKVDLLAAPLGKFAEKVPKDSRRVKPRPSVKLHASKLEEALAVERHSIRIPIEGNLTSGEFHRSEVLIPQAFSYLLMKLCAFRDRVDDANKQLGQHHALDIYRIVGLLTKDEYSDVKALAKEYASEAVVTEAITIISEHFLPNASIGRLRIREHALFTPAMNLERFAAELADLLLAP